MPWARAYAHLPTPYLVDENRIRVYYSSLDDLRIGRIGYVELDARNPLKVLHEAKEPVFDIGELGAFDDCGVTPSCVIQRGGQEWLYYIGWQRTERVPYMLFTGLAIRNGDAFERVSRTPILDRTDSEPFSRSAPFVLAGPRSGDLRMWYWTCIRWVPEAGGAHYYNIIRGADSEDGIRWSPESEPAVIPEGADEFAVGRPWVMMSGSYHKMLFSVRGHTRPYRIGYAESNDGRHWTRDDALAGLSVGEEAWENEMVCYPAMVRVRDRLLLFYNGNGHGRTGFGVAELESE